MRYLFITILSCLLFLDCANANERFYRNISEIGDYGSSTVTSIFKDSTGYVWLGTPGGVMRFDGVRAVSYPLPAPADRLTPINAINEVPGMLTVVGTPRGAFAIAADSTRCAPVTIICDINITAVERLGDTRLLMGTSAGLRIFDAATGKTDKLMLSNDVLSRSNAVSAMKRDGDNIFIATDDGIFRLAAATGKTERLTHRPLPVQGISSLAVAGDTLFMGTANDGLVMLSLDDMTTRNVDVGCNVVTSLDTDADGFVYVGTDGKGVIKLDPSTMKIADTIAHRNNSAGTPQSNQVYSLLVDNLGLLWIGYYQHGADYTLNNFGAFEIYNDPRFFNSRGMAIRTITMEPDYTTIGTREGLIMIDRTRADMTVFKRPALRSDMVIAVKPHDGNYYIGTYGGGMHVLNPATRRLSDFDPSRPDPFTNGHVFAITADSNGDLWTGTSAGLFRYRDGALVRHFSNHNSDLPAGNVYEVYFDSDGKGWICTENGIAIYDDDRDEIRTDVFPDGFINKEKVRVVYEDSRHNLFFLPEKGPIMTSDLNLSQFSQHDILGGADAKSIIEDTHGCIWITTDRGIMRWESTDAMPVRYGFADGIPSMNFTQCTPVVDNLGNLWFGNSAGLLRMSKQHGTSEQRTIGSRPVPSDILVEGQPYSVPALTIGSDSVFEIEFDQVYANVTVGLAAFTYTAPEAINYEYSIDGADWQPVDRNLDITLYNLSSGNHTLDIRNTNNHSASVGVMLSMPLSVSMKIIIALGIMALMMAVYIIVIKTVHRRQQLMEAARNTAQRLKRGNADKTDGSDVDSDSDDETADGTKPERTKYRTSRLKESECEEITRRMEEIIRERKPYTDPELKLVQFAEMTGVPGHKLSQVLSQHLNMKFYDYINRLRVEEFKRIASSDTLNRYTLSAMAEKAGFNSRASFFRHFKEIEGISPGEYIKSLDNH